MSERILIGVDPGVVGGIASVGHGNVCVWPMPSLERGKIDGLGFRKILQSMMPDRLNSLVVIEELSGFPKTKNPIQFAFSVGRNAGIVEGAFELFDFKVALVNPRTWTSALKLTGKSKAHRIELAKEMHPSIADRIVNDGIADSLLLIEYAKAHL